MQRVYDELEDPGLSQLFLGRNYSIAGIINAGFESTASQYGMMSLKIPILTIAQTQLVVEIWNANREMEPRLGKNWRNLQFAFFQGVRYYGVKRIEEREIHIFRLSSKNPEDRFLWLSNDRDDFWSNPISHVTCYSHIQAYNRAYLTTTIPDGYLDKSSGSNFGKIWQNKDNIHSKVYNLVQFICTLHDKNL